MATYQLAFIAHAVHRHGGQESASWEVLSRLAQQGMSVTVIAGTCTLDPSLARHVPLPPPKRPLALTASTFQARAARALAALGPVLSNSIGAAAREANVLTAQFCHAAYTAQFGGQRGRGWMGRSWQRVAQEVFIRHERRAYGSSMLRQVIAVSRGTAADIAAYYGVSPFSISVVPNGVDHARFHPVESVEARRALRERLGLPLDRVLAIFVGGDWERKGVADAVVACRGVPGLSLVVVGAGDGERVRQLAARTGTDVILTGLSRQPEAYCAAGDVYVYPTRYETFGMGALEGAASGLPVVSYRVHGVEDRVQDGVNGWLVQHDPEALRERLLPLVDDADMRARLGAASRESTLEYSWDRIAERYRAALDRAWQ